MHEGFHSFESHEEKVAESMPPIFELIERKAPTQEVVGQLMQDFYTPNRDNERICMAIFELLHRDLEGRAALSYVAMDSGEIGDVCKKIIQGVGSKFEWSSGIVEKELGVKRMSSFLPRMEDQRAMFQKFFEIAKEKKFFEGSFNEFIDRVFGNDDDVDDIRQLSGKTEKELINISATFGGSEPSYLEALGPINILHLKQQSNPDFLLLGSLGKYSTIEFDAFTKKINKNSRTNVVDIDWTMKPMFDELSAQHGVNFKVGDVLNLPYEENSMDLIASNYLLHGLTVADQQVKRIHVYKLMQQLHKVLKPGGIALLCERPYGSYQDDERSVMDMQEKVVDEICAVARKAGLEIFSVSDSLNFIFRQESMSATIDANGFPQYGNKTIMEGNQNQMFCLRKK